MRLTEMEVVDCTDYGIRSDKRSTVYPSLVLGRYKSVVILLLIPKERFVPWMLLTGGKREKQYGVNGFSIRVRRNAVRVEGRKKEEDEEKLPLASHIRL